MAMSGIRDMSTIEEAPMDRHPVQTYVVEHDWGILTEAIRRELRRGGQVFYPVSYTHLDVYKRQFQMLAAHIVGKIPQVSGVGPRPFGVNCRVELIAAGIHGLDKIIYIHGIEARCV